MFVALLPRLAKLLYFLHKAMNQQHSSLVHEWTGANQMWGTLQRPQPEDFTLAAGGRGGSTLSIALAVRGQGRLRMGFPPQPRFFGIQLAISPSSVWQDFLVLLKLSVLPKNSYTILR